MAKYDSDLYRIKADFCKTLADPKRQMIISELSNGEKTVGELVDTIGVSQPTISRHLAVMRSRGAVKARRHGANVYYSLIDRKIGEACNMMHAILLRQIAKNRDFADRIKA